MKCCCRRQVSLEREEEAYNGLDIRKYSRDHDGHDVHMGRVECNKPEVLGVQTPFLVRHGEHVRVCEQDVGADKTWRRVY